MYFLQKLFLLTTVKSFCHPASLLIFGIQPLLCENPYYLLFWGIHEDIVQFPQLSCSIFLIDEKSDQKSGILETTKFTPNLV